MRGTQSESNLHTPTAGASVASKAPSRSYRACTWCRAHKRKCDGLEPCTTCSNSPDGRKCEYAPPQKRGRKIKRQYDDKLSIEHVIKRRQDEVASYPEVLPVYEGSSNRSLGSSIAPLRIPEGPTLNIRISPSPLELPPPSPIPSSRYPDSLTSPQRYNYSSKYNSLSSPEISRVASQDSIPLPRLPQIFLPGTDDNISRQSSFSILPSPRQTAFYDSSSTPSLSGSRQEFRGGAPSITQSLDERGDFITASKLPGSHSHPLMLSTRRYSLQHAYTPIRDTDIMDDDSKEAYSDDEATIGTGAPDKYS